MGRFKLPDDKDNKNGEVLYDPSGASQKSGKPTDGEGADEVLYDPAGSNSSVSAQANGQSSEPSTWEKLTRPYNPDLEAFTREHPILGTGARILDAIGSLPFGVIDTLRNTAPVEGEPLFSGAPIKRRTEGSALAPWTKAATWKAIPSVLPEAIGQVAGNLAFGELAGAAGEAVPRATSLTATRLLRGPGGFGDIESPVGKFPGITRELEARIPRNEPPTARAEMYEDLASRRAARGEEQEQLDAANESRLKAAESARQKEITDQARLKEQDARSRMARGREQGALDKAQEPTPPPRPGKSITMTVERPKQTVAPRRFSIAQTPSQEFLNRQTAATEAAQREGIEGSVARPSGRLVLTPGEAQAERQMQSIAETRARQHGMQYAAGMRPAGGGRVPFTPTRSITEGYPAPREVIHFNPEELEDYLGKKGANLRLAAD